MVKSRRWQPLPPLVQPLPDDDMPRRRRGAFDPARLPRLRIRILVRDAVAVLLGAASCRSLPAGLLAGRVAVAAVVGPHLGSPQRPTTLGLRISLPDFCRG